MLGLNRLSENVFRRPGRFFWCVIKGFKHNQGLLLSGAVAYYMLLSIVPLLALLLVGLSQIYPTDALLDTLNRELRLVIPAGGAVSLPVAVGVSTRTIARSCRSRYRFPTCAGHLPRSTLRTWSS